MLLRLGFSGFGVLHGKIESNYEAINFIQVIILIVLSCKELDSKQVGIQDKKIGSTLDSIKYVNYVYAIKNQSTFQYFTGLQIRNLKH